MPTRRPDTVPRTGTLPRATTGKRSRVSRACDQCRAAREKCDGLPTCSTCSQSNRACTYTANPKKRGIQPGYIRTLELALTWLFQNTDAETVLSRKLSQEGASSVLLQKDTTESNKLHKSWRRSKFCKDVEKLLSGAELGDEGARYPESDDQDSDTEDPPPQSIFNLPESSDSSGAPVHTATPVQMPITRVPQEKTTPLPANRWQLFDIYFAYTHCWFPICEKHDILKLSYSYPENGLQLSPSMPSSGDHAELWSILALASLQELPIGSATLTPEGIYAIARRLIPLELSQFELGHVKALLLLALFNLSQSHPTAAWLVVGHASRILLSMVHNQQTPRYKHAYLACFFLDQLLSMQMGLLPYLKFSNMHEVGKVDENGLEEWAPWVGSSNTISASAQSRTPALTLSTYNRLVDLFRVMSLVEYTASPMAVPHGLIDRLEEWEATALTAAIPGIPGSSEMTATPAALLLQAFYRCCRLFLQPANNWAQSMFDVLDSFQVMFAGVALPPVVHSLLDIAGRVISSSPQNDSLRARLESIYAVFDSTWRGRPDVQPATRFRLPTGTHDPGRVFEARRNPPRSSFGSTVQIPTPESVQMSADQSLLVGTHFSEYSNLPGDALTNLEPPLPNQRSQCTDLGIAPRLQEFDGNQIRHASIPSLMEQWQPNELTRASSQNIETFFDELASLDGAERVESQPQFMQNLGFAPDARIADLSNFGQLTAILGYPPS